MKEKKPKLLNPFCKLITAPEKQHHSNGKQHYDYDYERSPYQSSGKTMKNRASNCKNCQTFTIRTLRSQCKNNCLGSMAIHWNLSHQDSTAWVYHGISLYM